MTHITSITFTFTRGVKWGLTMSHTTTIDKVEQLGRAYDENELKWQAEQERLKKFQVTPETISECIEGMRGSLGC